MAIQTIRKGEATLWAQCSLGCARVLTSGRGILAGGVAVPGDHLSSDGSIPAIPLPACPFRPPRVPEVVEEDVNIEFVCAFVEPSSESVDLLADLGAKRGISEGIPRLSEEIRKLPSPDASPPGQPLS